MAGNKLRELLSGGVVYPENGVRFEIGLNKPTGNKTIMIQ